MLLNNIMDIIAKKQGEKAIKHINNSLKIRIKTLERKLSFCKETIFVQYAVKMF